LWRWKPWWWFMYEQTGLLRRNHGTRCTTKASQQIVVQKRDEPGTREARCPEPRHWVSHGPP
jgi:hypothetical protein